MDMLAAGRQVAKFLSASGLAVLLTACSSGTVGFFSDDDGSTGGDLSDATATVASLSILSSTSQLASNADGTTAPGVTFVVLAKDANNVVVPGADIAIGASSGALRFESPSVTSGFATTDENGETQVTLTTGGDSTLRQIAVTAAANGKSAAKVFNVVAPGTGGGDENVPAAIQLVASSATLLSNAATTANGVTLTGYVTDGNGNTVPDTIVQFSVSSGAIQVLNGGATDSSGAAQAILTTGGNTTPRTITVTATVKDTTISSTFNVSVITAAGSILLTPSSNQIVGTAGVTITATVRDTGGALLSGATVTFTTPVSTGGVLSVPSATTNGSGQATTVLTAGSDPTPRTITVTAAVPGASNATVSVEVVVAGGITLTANKTVLASDANLVSEGVTITATVRDDDGSQLANVPVTFASGTTTNGSTGGTLSVSSTTTNSSGQATTVLTTGGDTSLRTIVVTASSQGAPDATLSIPVQNPLGSLTLLTSTPQLLSSASTTAQGATITALLKDSANNAVAGQTITFSSALSSASSCTAGQGGAIVLPVAGTVTDANGIATATLTTGGDQLNQVIEVTASVPGLSPPTTLDIPVTGTTMLITGTTSVGLDEVVTYTVRLADAGNSGLVNQSITITSANDNLGSGTTDVSTLSLTTNAAGQATFSYRGRNGGADTITAVAGSAGCASASFSNTVSAVSLSVTTPAAATQIPFGDIETVTFHLEGGTVGGGDTLHVSTTRGLLDNGVDPPASAVDITTDATGDASLTISQTAGAGAAGGAVISAVEDATGVTTSVTVQFTSTTPAQVSLQGAPTGVPVNGSSVVTATVRDAFNNLVTGARVNFTLNDPTGGSLSASTGLTSVQGVISTTYSATQTPSAKDGVTVTANVLNSSNAVVDSDNVLLTVGGTALRVTLGTGKTVNLLGTVSYSLPYQVQVTDSAGNPPPSGTIVSLKIDTLSYLRGDLAHNGVVWTYDDFIDPANWQTSLQVPVPAQFGCVNEDANRNGILDDEDTVVRNGMLDGGEDANGNGSLDSEDNTLVGVNPGNGNGFLEPGNAASVPSSVTLDATGIEEFNVSYAQDRALWSYVRLSATTTVSGTASSTFQDFILPGRAEDYSEADESPPGVVSPYGFGDTATLCTDPP